MQPIRTGGPVLSQASDGLTDPPLGLQAFTDRAQAPVAALELHHA
jgi:hypothetical protein